MEPSNVKYHELVPKQQQKIVKKLLSDSHRPIKTNKQQDTTKNLTKSPKQQENSNQVIVFAGRLSYDTSQYTHMTVFSYMISCLKLGNRTYNMEMIKSSIVVQHYFQNLFPNSYENCHTKLEKYHPKIVTKKRKLWTKCRKCK